MKIPARWGFSLGVPAECGRLDPVTPDWQSWGAKELDRFFSLGAGLFWVEVDGLLTGFLVVEKRLKGSSTRSRLSLELLQSL